MSSGATHRFVKVGDVLDYTLAIAEYVTAVFGRAGYEQPYRLMPYLSKILSTGERPGITTDRRESAREYDALFIETALGLYRSFGTDIHAGMISVKQQALLTILEKNI